MKKYTILLSLLVIILLIACNNTAISTSQLNIKTNSTSEELSFTKKPSTVESTYSVTSLPDSFISTFSSNKETNIPTVASSQITSSSNTTNINLTIDDLLKDAIINDQNFIDYYKSLKDNDEISSNAIYASIEGNGDGSKDNPYSLEEALDNLNPGDTLYLREGIYIPSTNEGFFINRSGNSDNYITIRNYPGEQAIITNNSNKNEVYGFQIEADTSYLIIEGLEIKDISAYNAFGIAVWGDNQNHIILKNNSIHDIKTTSNNESDSNSSANGILFNGEAKSSINNIIIANNHIYNNVTGWAESLSIAGNCEYFYVINNIVENNTNIGIDFYGNAGYCSDPKLDQPRYSLAAGNIIKKSICSYADCAGLYVDGARDILLQYNEISDSLYGIEIGSEERNDSYPVKNIIVRYNKCINNNLSLRIGGYEEVNTGVVTNTEIYDNYFISNYTDYQLILAKCDTIIIRNNYFYINSKNVILFEFSDSYIKNISIENNIFYYPNNKEDILIFTIYNNDLSFNDFNNIYGINIYQEFVFEI